MASGPDKPHTNPWVTSTMVDFSDRSQIAATVFGIDVRASALPRQASTWRS